MKLVASAMLSAAIKRQSSSELLLLRQCLPVFDEICAMALNFVFFVRVTLIKIANTSLDTSLGCISLAERTAAALAFAKSG